jgi:hypothetical protein
MERQKGFLFPVSCDDTTNSLDNGDDFQPFINGGSFITTTVSEEYIFEP